MIRQAALGVKFALELCLLAALTTWGFETSSSVVAKVVLGVGAALAAVIWGRLAAPRAPRRLRLPQRLVLELGLLAFAAAALAAAGHAALALIFALAVVLDTAVLVATGEADA